MTALTILQLFPDELGVAGDRGNVMAVRRVLEDAGHQVSIVLHGIGDTLPTDVDLVIIGNGPLSAMRNVHADLLANADALGALKKLDVPFFAYGAGAELLGNSIRLLDGTSIVGVGILPMRAERVKDRTVGYAIVESPFGQVVGFEDNASRWTLESGAKPLGILEAGGGNGEGAVDGVLDGAAIGTNIGGPLLPLNPVLTYAIISFIATRRGFAPAMNIAGTPLDLYASRARDVIVSHARHVFARI